MSATEADLTAPKLVLDLLNGFRSSKVLFTLVKLGVPDLIAHQPQQQVSLAALAALLAASPACKAAGGAEPSHDGLGRLLDAAVSLGLLGGDGKSYWLTEVTKAYLLSVSKHHSTAVSALCQHTTDDAGSRWHICRQILLCWQ
jgi:hypothetical protein